MVPKCTQIKALAVFWVSTMPPSAILGHGLGWVSTWRPYRKKVRIKNPWWLESPLKPRQAAPREGLGQTPHGSLTWMLTTY